MIGLGIGLTGFGYLGYKISDMNRNKAAYLAEGQTYMSPLVQKRLSNTFGWFGYGILTTSAFYLGDTRQQMTASHVLLIRMKLALNYSDAVIVANASFWTTSTLRFLSFMSCSLVWIPVAEHTVATSCFVFNS